MALVLALEARPKFTGIAVVAAPHFTAGISFRRGRISRVHPDLSYMEVGWTYEQLERFVDFQHWDVIKLREA
jgi:hypothetical protein